MKKMKTCIVTDGGYRFEDGHIYESMSLTKGALGLAFLSQTRPEVLKSLLVPSSDTDTTIEEALCHFTGVENDQSFDYDEFMDLVKKESTFPYSVKTFVNSEFKGNQFDYNNIVWRILVQRYYEFYGHKPSEVLSTTVPGLEFVKDGEGFMLGLNGMLMTCETALRYAEWARGILLRHRADLLKYPHIPKRQEFWSNIAGDDRYVHPYFGWFIATLKEKPRVPIAAISIGYMNQFVCIDLINTSRAPGIQLRDPYYEEGGDGFVERYLE